MQRRPTEALQETKTTMSHTQKKSIREGKGFNEAKEADAAIIRSHKST